MINGNTANVMSPGPMILTGKSLFYPPFMGNISAGIISER
jgi:hypothetical protein